MEEGTLKTMMFNVANEVVEEVIEPGHPDVPMNSDPPSSKLIMNHMNLEASLCSEVGNDWHGLSQLSHTSRLRCDLHMRNNKSH